MANLTPFDVHALNEALEDEYRAWATYDQLISDFGNVQPFINIRESEARHIEALTLLFERYELPVPLNTWIGKVERYSDLKDACRAAVNAEIENGKMYERLLGTTQQPAILAVLRNLQEASQRRHLPALQRALQENGVGCRVGGRRRRRA